MVPLCLPNYNQCHQSCSSLPFQAIAGHLPQPIFLLNYAAFTNMPCFLPFVCLLLCPEFLYLSLLIKILSTLHTSSKWLLQILASGYLFIFYQYILHLYKKHLLPIVQYFTFSFVCLSSSFNSQPLEADNHKLVTISHLPSLTSQHLIECTGHSC